MINVFAFIDDEHKIVKPLESSEKVKIKYIKPDQNYIFELPYPDIIIVVSDWRHNVAKILIDAKVLGIPSLMLQDGTLDWLIQYQGDLYAGSGGAAHYHPILSDKIACIGHQTARILSSWCGAEKVEVVGFPILKNEIEDSIQYKREKNIVNCKEKYNILVTSPRQGWFCEEHKVAFLEALHDLKEYVVKQNNLDVTWRLARNLSNILQVENKLKEKESYELVELIKECDIVISAQSTVVIEAMLYGKPVAIVDYLNSPQFYGTAWFISCKEQIEKTISSMIQCKADRMLYQEYQLNDVLYFKENAVDRTILLIEKMVDWAKYNNIKEIVFPENLLQYNSPFNNVIPVNIKDVYPNIDKFVISEADKYYYLNSRLNGELNKFHRKANLSSKILKKIYLIIKNIKRN